MHIVFGFQYVMVVVLKPGHFFLPANSVSVYADRGGAVTFSLLYSSGKE